MNKPSYFDLIGVIESVKEIRKGIKNGKEWHKYLVTVDGIDYESFDGNYAELVGTEQSMKWYNNEYNGKRTKMLTDIKAKKPNFYRNPATVNTPTWSNPKGVEHKEIMDKLNEILSLLKGDVDMPSEF